MIADIITILRKEMKELLFQRARFKGGMLGFLLFLGVFGIFMPLQSGAAWVENPISLIYWSWIPFLLVSSVIADAFAGERERHTLETLLASRLSDQAILFGKIAAAVFYGWGLTMLCVLLSLITSNLAFSQGAILFYPVKVAIAIPVFSLLVSLLATGLGIIVSLRAGTVRQAQQTFSIAFFLLFIPLFVLPLIPETYREKIVLVLMKVNLETLVVVIAGFVLVLDIILLLVAMRQFKRNRLILD